MSSSLTYLAIASVLAMGASEAIGADVHMPRTANVRRMPAKNGLPRARIKIRQRPNERNWADVDASASWDRNGIEHYTYWVIDAKTRSVLRGPLRTDSARQGFALRPGLYRFLVQVVDGDGASDTAESHPLRIRDSDSFVSSEGATYSTADDEVWVFTLSEDETSVNLETLASEVAANDSSLMWITAWGAQGGKGSNAEDGSLFNPVHVPGGDPGAQGQVTIVTTLGAFKTAFGTSTIHYFLGNHGTHDSGVTGNGGQGGASTLVLNTDPTGQALSLSNVVLLAGGSGGGGRAGSSSKGRGQDGGAGGCSLAELNVAVAQAGSDGISGGNHGVGGDGGGGGIGGEEASGGACGQGSLSSGTDGIGGAGGNGYKSGSVTKWSNGDPKLNDEGNGGNSDDKGGGGGGGYGGGGGAICEGGGGGGGSYQSASTETTSNAPKACVSPNSAPGIVKVFFYAPGF